MRSRSDGTCQIEMLPLPSFITPNIFDLLLIVFDKWKNHVAFTLISDPWNEIEVRWTLSDTHEEVAKNSGNKYTFTFKVNNSHLFLFSRWTMKRDWKNMYMWQPVISYRYTRYDASRSCSFCHLKHDTKSVYRQCCCQIVIPMSCVLRISSQERKTRWSKWKIHFYYTTKSHILLI